MRLSIALILLFASHFCFGQNFRCAAGGNAVPPVVFQPYSDADIQALTYVKETGEDVLERLGISNDHYAWRAASNIVNFQIEINKSNRKVEVYTNLTFVKNMQNRLDDSHFYTLVTIILYHEIAHHVAGHTIIGSDGIGNGGNYESELAADRFAGKYLGQIAKEIQEEDDEDFDEDDFLEACHDLFKYFTTVGSTESHPAREDRLEAFEEGYSDNFGTTIYVIDKKN